MRTDMWTVEKDARLRELWAAGLSGTSIAERLTQEFKSETTKSAVIGRKRRLNLPDPARTTRALKIAKNMPEWTLEQRIAQGERLKRYWKERRQAEARGEPCRPKVQLTPDKFETIEQFLARGGKIQRIEIQPDNYPVGVPAFPTGGRRHAAAP